ncbi:MAG TPA: metallophosphoesterase, partial [Polyangiaceae bacterium]|nr:metallophosphoesterase [Polyangiaceae bacterium]
MGFLLVAFGAAFAASAFAHLTLYRWALRAFPALGRARTALAAALVVLFLWPLARALGRSSSLPGSLRGVAQLGSTWHLFVVLSMALYGAGLLLAAGLRRVSRRRGASAEAAGRPLALDAQATAGGDASSSAPSVPPPTSLEGPAPLAPHDDRRATAALSRRRFVEAAGGAGALAASAGALGWGLRVSRFDWRVEEVPVRLPRLPRALDGFTIVQISDLHVGPLWRERELRQGLSFVDALRPDLVVVTGDIIDHDSSYVPLAARLLRSLSAREGVAFVPGNHDHYAGARAVVEGLSSAG